MAKNASNPAARRSTLHPPTIATLAAGVLNSTCPRRFALDSEEGRAPSNGIPLKLRIRCGSTAKRLTRAPRRSCERNARPPPANPPGEDPNGPGGKFLLQDPYATQPPEVDLSDFCWSESWYAALGFAEGPKEAIRRHPQGNSWLIRRFNQPTNCRSAALIRRAVATPSRRSRSPPRSVDRRDSLVGKLANSAEVPRLPRLSRSIRRTTTPPSRHPELSLPAIRRT